MFILETKNNINISFIEPDQYDRLYEFRRKMKPEQHDIEDYYKQTAFSNPYLSDKSNGNILVAQNNKGEVIGHIICTPREFYVNGIRSKYFQYYDFLVLEEYRRQAVGLSLLRTALKTFKPCVAINVTETTKRICEFLNINLIGNLNKYVWFKDFIVPTKIFINLLLNRAVSLKSDKNSRDHSPSYLMSPDYEFVLLNSPEQLTEFRQRNNMIEFSRSKNYLRWKFFKSKENYYFYISTSQKHPAYFVAKIISWRGVKLVEITDYRTNSGSKNEFKAILDASKYLAQVLGIDGVTTMSSHKYFDEVLKQNRFIKVGRPIDILTNAKINLTKKSSRNRDLIFATLGDKI